MKSVMTKHTKTVAVSTPLKAMPVPGVERIEGFTTTMYDIVKNVVMPAMASVRMFGFAISEGLIVEIETGMTGPERVYVSAIGCARLI